jgi:hypothetical protein
VSYVVQMTFQFSEPTQAQALGRFSSVARFAAERLGLELADFHGYQLEEVELAEEPAALPPANSQLGTFPLVQPYREDDVVTRPDPQRFAASRQHAGPVDEEDGA